MHTNIDITYWGNSIRKLDFLVQCGVVEKWSEQLFFGVWQFYYIGCLQNMNVKFLLHVSTDYIFNDFFFV